jgi:hypothetical protein
MDDRRPPCESTPKSTPKSKRVSTRKTAHRLRQSHLLRIHEDRVEHVVLRYELIDLASGCSRQFASLAALQRHLRSITAPSADAAEPA